MDHIPCQRLSMRAKDQMSFYVDEALLARSGILVAFSTRQGGRSVGPYAGLNLAGHSGDDPGAVDENRRDLLGMWGLDAGRLVTAQQVHGDDVVVVTAADAGRGARVTGGRSPIEGTDAMITSESDLPLMMMYADCVPVLLVAEGPRRAVAVVHAGWRGALSRLPAKTAVGLARTAGCREKDLSAYIGAHICSECYEVGEELAVAFDNEFASSSHSVSIRSGSPRVDLGQAVGSALTDAGVRPERVIGLGMCTSENLSLFYSYRAEGVTGRHGALTAVLPA